MVRRLERAPVTGDIPLPRRYAALQDTAMHRLGVGTTRTMRSVITRTFLPSLTSRDYTLREKAGVWRGRRSPGASARDRTPDTDLTRQITGLSIPAYLLHRRHDRTVSYGLAKEAAGQVEAPHVGFYTFEQSAHSPALEEPDRTLRILVEDVLAGTTTLADPPDRGGASVDRR